MGRSENFEECSGVSVRRSTRKRTLKKDADFEYDFDYPKITDQPTSSTFYQVVKPAKKSKSMMANPKKAKKEVIRIVPEPAAYEEVEEDSDSNIFREDSSFDSNSTDYTNYTKEIVSDERRQLMFNSVVKLQTSDLIRMDSSQIIEVHCENLMRRLENVAHSYLETWNIPYPVFYPPSSFLGGNPLIYPAGESDEYAVNMVVENMIKAVATVYN